VALRVYLLADFGPGLLQPVDGAAVQGGGDLQHAVVVVEAAADVGHGHPLLDGAGPRAHVRVGHDLRGHQVAHLKHGRREQHHHAVPWLLTKRIHDDRKWIQYSFIA